MTGENLNRILKIAYQTEYYKQIYNAKKINVSNVRFEELPFVTQRDLIENWELFRNNKQEIFRVSASSGTTKHPKVVHRTVKDFETSSKVMESMLRAINITNKDVVYIGQPFDLASFGYLVLEGCKKIGALALPGGLGQSDEKMLEIIQWGKASVIMTSPSSIKELMKILLIEENKILRQEIIRNVKKIVVAGEPCRKSDRNQIESFWSCEVYDFYGSEETDSLGYSDNDEYITLMKDYFYFEFLELPHTSKFELVITSLYLEGTPLIRYKLGDIVEKNEFGQIKIIGKTFDVLYLYDGVKLYAFQIEDAISTVIKHDFSFQIVCDYIDSMDCLTILIDYKENEMYSNEEINTKIVEAIWNSSLDFEVYKILNKLKVTVKLNSGEIHITRRGKIPKIVDNRKEKNVQFS